MTVQTTKSFAWRRRFFNLRSEEIKLFKSDNEAEVLMVLDLKGAVVSAEYEDSQVRGSWKLESAGEVSLVQ